MMLDVWSPLPSSVLAFVTSVHAGMLVLRKHRSRPSNIIYLLLLPPAALAAQPWVYPSLVGIAAGLGGHLLWFVLSGRICPPPKSAAPPTPRPAAPGAAATYSQAPKASPPRPANNGFTPAPVLAVIPESPDVRTFRLARPPDTPVQAGQFLTVRLQIDGKAHTRCYSISSAPQASGFLEITVKRQGLVSGLLHATLERGSTLLIGRPSGRFVYPEGDARPIVLLAGGIGITPLMSMLRHAVAADPARSVTLLYSARSVDDLVFYDELRVIARRHPHVRVVPTLTCPNPPSGFRGGRIDAALVREHVPYIEQAISLICGPLPMISQMQAMLAELGVRPDQVRKEAFEAAAGARGDAPAPDVPAAAEAPVPTEAPRPAESLAAGSSLTMRLTRTGCDVPVLIGQTLLEAAEAAGADMPSMCRAGVCGTCRTRLISGDVRCTSALAEGGEASPEWILPCVTWAQSDCTIEG